MSIKSYKTQFIDLALKANALSFGEFTLKSGRISPYFFNAGQFNTGEQLATLGGLYADRLADATLEYDLLFGPAYKGIPLVSSLAIALSRQYEQNIPYCFNRKIVKDHGEGGRFVGYPLQGRVLIIDDVITAGTAIRESIDWIQQANATLAGIVLMLDRQERGKNHLSAAQEISQDYGIPVISIINLDDLMTYLSTNHDGQLLKAIQAYRVAYGVELCSE